jgi:hypothetical protein
MLTGEKWPFEHSRVVFDVGWGGRCANCNIAVCLCFSVHELPQLA